MSGSPPSLTWESPEKQISEWNGELIRPSLDFYWYVLGFDLAWSWGEPPDIAAVCRDGVEITLTQRAGAKPVGAAHVYRQ
jgi:hypothetical protein